MLPAEPPKKSSVGERLGLDSSMLNLNLEPKCTNSLFNVDSFYANFTNTTFQNIPIPHLTRTMKQKFLH